MKKINKIKTTSKTAMAMSGILVAFLLFFQQPYSYQLSVQDNNIATEQNDDSDKAEYQIVAYEVLIPVLQLNLFHSFDLLVETQISEEIQFTELPSDNKVFHNYFETLFRQIISPNAP